MSWTKCEDRLPDKDGCYLVTLQYCDFNYITLLYWQNSKQDFGKWKEDNDNEEWMPIDDVIAWQPLPEPYKEEE